MRLAAVAALVLSLTACNGGYVPESDEAEARIHHEADVAVAKQKAAERMARRAAAPTPAAAYVPPSPAAYTPAQSTAAEVREARPWAAQACEIVLRRDPAELPDARHNALRAASIDYYGWVELSTELRNGGYTDVVVSICNKQFG